MDGTDAESSREFIEYLEVPLRRPWHVVIPLVCVVALSLAVSLAMTELYRSSTLILVESEKVPDGFVAKTATESAGRQLQTLKQEVLSRTRLERIIHELAPYPKAGTVSGQVDRMRLMIGVNIKGNDAFTIDFVHQDPAKARDVANRLATLFIEEAAESRAKQVEGATQFIATQLAEARQTLEGQETAMRRFKERNMGQLPEQTGANLATLQRLQSEQQSVELNLQGALERLRALEKVAASGGTVTSSNPDAELNQLRSQLATLRSRYTDEHPDVRQLASRVARIEERLAGTPQAPPPPGAAPALDKARGEVESLEARLRNVEQRIDQFQGRVELAPRTEQELSTLTRDYQKHKENYLALLQKQMAAEQAEQLEKRWKGQQFRILDPAFLPDRPFFPNRQLFVFVGLLAGLLVGVGISVAVELMDSSLKTVRDVEALTPFPVLATLRHVKAPPARGTPWDIGSKAAGSR